MLAYDIIRRPVNTEKTNIQQEKANQVTFEVDRRANRVEIARAVEKAFKTKVAAVQYDSGQGQKETGGQTSRQTAGLEKGRGDVDAGRENRVF